MEMQSLAVAMQLLLKLAQKLEEMYVAPREE